MRKVGKFGPEGSQPAPEDTGGDAPQTAEASENAPQVPAGGAAYPALPLPAHDLRDRLTGFPAAVPGSGPDRPSNAREDIPDEAQGAGEALDNAAHAADLGAGAYALSVRGADERSAAPQAPGPSDPRRRSSADPENRAEAVASDAWESDPAGVPSPAPPELASAAPAGTPGKLGPILSGRAVRAWGPRHARAPEDRRDQAAAPSAPALPAPVGADGSAAPADAGAPSDPKRGPDGGVRDRADGRNPERAAPEPQAPGATPALLPSAGRLSGRLAALAETAKAYARSAQADNTQRAYAADWRQFASWLRRQGLPETPPDPEAVGLYLAAQVERRGAELSVATLERRLSGIAWRYRQLGQPLEIRDRHIATVLAGIRRRHGRPPLQKAAIFADELLAMLATLEMDLRGLRDRAILAIGFAGGLRRSEIVGLDCGPGQTEDGSGWVELFPEGALLTIRGKTGWRDVEIGRGSRPDTCPVALLETWLRLGRISHGPLFRPIARKNGGVSGARLTDKHVVRLVKRCALAAGLRGDLAEGERRRAFGGHSLRAGLASSAQIEEAHVQKHLGHASAEMTRRYQRKRDRFTINLTKAAGL
jgi:integrase